MKNLSKPATNPLADNLEILMASKGIKTASELAKQMGLPSATVYRMTDATSNPTMSSLQRLSQFFNVSVSQLIGEDPLPLTEDVHESKTKEKNIPILTFDDALSLIKEQKSYLDPQNAKYIKIDIELSDAAFAIIMKGNSMFPIFPNGTLLICDPAKDIYDQCYALVYLNKFGQCFFKQVIFAEPNIFIKSVKPEISDLDMIKLENKDKVIAVLIQSKTNY